MGRFLQVLKGLFWGDWLFSLLSALGVAFIVWLLYAMFTQVEINIGISSDSFNVFCGVVATLSGALLGLLIAARSFFTHHAITSLHNNKSILLKESHWLESWLSSSKELPNSDILQKLKALLKMCKGALNITEEDVELDNVKSMTEGILESCEHLNSEHKTMLYTEKKKLDELESKHDPKDEDIESLHDVEKEVQRLEEGMLALQDLLDHLASILFCFPRIRMSFLSFDLVKQLDKLAAMSGFVLIVTLICLVLSGSNFFGMDVPADTFRLYLALYLILMLAFAILFIYRILSLHREMVTLEVGVKS